MGPGGSSGPGSWSGWRARTSWVARDRAGRNGTYNAGCVNGNGTAKLRSVLLDVRPDVFWRVLFTRQLALLSNAARGFALSPRRTDDLGGGDVALAVVVIGRIGIHSLKIEENCREGRRA